MSKWEPGDDPFNEHRNGFPHCDFFNHQESNSGSFILFKCLLSSRE